MTLLLLFGGYGIAVPLQPGNVPIIYASSLKTHRANASANIEARDSATIHAEQQASSTARKSKTIKR